MTVDNRRSKVLAVSKPNLSVVPQGRPLDGLSKTDASLVQFAQRLVETPSLPGAEGLVSALVADELKALGYHDIEIDGYGNVVGHYGSGAPRLMFNGHIDHVPPGDMQDPYSAALVDGEPYGHAGTVLRGRGSCDMKANVAAGAYAVAYLDEADALQGTYIFTADVQEETDSPVGIQSLLERGLRADYGLSGESTSLRVSLGHRGKLQFDVTVHGRSSHASTPADGINAVLRATPFLAAIEDAASNLSVDDFFGGATMTVTGISSDPQEDVAVVPHRCTIRVDRRYVPGETPESCLDELSRLVAHVAEQTETEADVALVNIYPLMAIAPEHPLVALAQQAVAQDGAPEDTELMAWRFGVNATFMSEAGIPTVGIGPGSEDVAHTNREHVPVDELIAASQASARLLSLVCAAEAEDA